MCRSRTPGAPAGQGGREQRAGARALPLPGSGDRAVRDGAVPRPVTGYRLPCPSRLLPAPPLTGRRPIARLRSAPLRTPAPGRPRRAPRPPPPSGTQRAPRAPGLVHRVAGPTSHAPCVRQRGGAVPRGSERASGAAQPPPKAGGTAAGIPPRRRVRPRDPLGTTAPGPPGLCREVALGLGNHVK